MDSFNSLVVATAKNENSEKLLEDLVALILEGGLGLIGEYLSVILGPPVKLTKLTLEEELRIYCAVKVIHAIYQQGRANELSRDSVKRFLDRIRTWPPENGVGSEHLVNAKKLIKVMNPKPVNILDHPVDE